MGADRKLILDAAFADPVGTRAGDLAGAAAERRLSLLEKVDTLKAGEADRVLPPWAGESRTLVKKLRDEGVLLGLPLGRRPDCHNPVDPIVALHYVAVSKGHGCGGFYRGSWGDRGGTAVSPTSPARRCGCFVCYVYFV